MTDWRLFIVALVLPVLFTALVLMEVQRNRGGVREAIELTEREVGLSGDSDENSGMTAWLTWADISPPGQPWVPRDTLRTLGFDLSALPDGDFRGVLSRQLQRRAYVALELRDDQQTRSRLVPVDASVDRAMLLAKYPNGRTHLIAAGFIGVRQVRRPGGLSAVEGYLVNIDPRGIHVPTEIAERLRRGAMRNRTFTLSLRYGSRLEPWIVNAR